MKLCIFCNIHMAEAGETLCGTCAATLAGNPSLTRAEAFGLDMLPEGEQTDDRD